ncbi:MAG: hypothetical protein RIS73_1659 [Bacteroidota bacterium]
MKHILTVIIAATTFTSCGSYYKVITTNNPVTTAAIADLNTKNKYFILRNGNQAFAMTNISFTDSLQILQCNLQTLPDEHKLHLTKGVNGKMRYQKTRLADEDKSIADGNETGLLNEVHIYTTIKSNTATGSLALPVSDMQKFEVIEKDKQKTKRSKALGTGIVVATSVLIVGGIAALAVERSLSSMHF